MSVFLIMRLSFDQYRRGFLDGTKRGDDSNAGVGKRTKRRQDHSLKLREGRAVEDQRVIDDVDAAIADLAKLASDAADLAQALQQAPARR